MTKNQNNKNDSGKPKISLVPPAIIWDIAQVREYGNRKYNSPDGWKTVEPQRYIDALLRHTLEFMRDPLGRDAESGIAHYKHMACILAFLCEFFGKKSDPGLSDCANEKKTVRATLEEIGEDVCTHYCKHFDAMYSDDVTDDKYERMAEQYCVDCPLSKLY